MKSPKLNLEQLTKEWYAKLEQSGFSDIETADGYLKVWDSFQLVRVRNAVRAEEQREYYICAEHFLTNHKFDSDIQKQIWKAHSEGHSIREIETAIRKSGRKTSKQTIQKNINYLAKWMLAERNGKKWTGKI